MGNGQRPWFKMFPSDFLTGTADLSCEEVGAYILLLLHAWERDGRLPREKPRLARLFHLDDETFSEVWKAIEGKFTEDESGLYNPRLEATRVDAEEAHQRRVEAGRLGGRPESNAKAKAKQRLNKGSVHARMTSDSSSLNSKKKRDQSIEADFERFWKVYPRKVGKRPALRAWKKLGKARPDADVLIAAVLMQAGSDDWQKDGGQYIPHPTTWLNQGRWEDELPPASTRAANRPKHDPTIAAEMDNYGWGRK
jgi:uncharacterized protein YdaU (DUF1376 family)